MKRGQVCLVNLHKSLSSVVAELRRSIKAVENPRVVSLADEIDGCLVEHLEDLEDLLESEYSSGVYGPQLKSCGANAEGGGGFQPGNDCAGDGGGSSGGNSSGTKTAKATKATKAEKNAVVDYTTDKFVTINSGLRTGNLDSADKKIVQKIDSYLAKAPKRPGATVRSFDIPEGEFDKYAEMFKEGAVYQDKAYLSTTKKPTASDSIAFKEKVTGGSRVVMRVDGKSGVDISGLSTNPGEQEVLYPRGTKFRVNKVVTTKDGGILAMIEEITKA